MTVAQNTAQVNAPTNRTAECERARAVDHVRVAAVTQANPQPDLRVQRAQVRAMARTEGLWLVGIAEDAGASAHDLHRPGLVRLFTLLNDPTIVRNPARLPRMLIGRGWSRRSASRWRTVKLEL
jgi:hypothetical protein